MISCFVVYSVIHTKIYLFFRKSLVHNSQKFSVFSIASVLTIHIAHATHSSLELVA